MEDSHESRSGSRPEETGPEETRPRDTGAGEFGADEFRTDEFGGDRLGGDWDSEPDFPDAVIMPEGSLYTERFPMALAYAATKHAAHRRKDDFGTPYISHPVAVSMLVFRHGQAEPEFADELEDLAIAGLLHDVAEDAGGRAALAEIRALFGDRVAQVVTAATDAMPDPGEEKAPWRPRKEAHLQRVARLAGGNTETGQPADRGACLVIACDKFHNLSGTADQVRRDGDAFLDRFRGGVDGTRWYFAEMRDTLAPALPAQLLADIDEALATLGRPASG